MAAWRARSIRRPMALAWVVLRWRPGRRLYTRALSRQWDAFR